MVLSVWWFYLSSFIDLACQHYCSWIKIFIQKFISKSHDKSILSNKPKTYKSSWSWDKLIFFWFVKKWKTLENWLPTTTKSILEMNTCSHLIKPNQSEREDKDDMTCFVLATRPRHFPFCKPTQLITPIYHQNKNTTTKRYLVFWLGIWSGGKMCCGGGDSGYYHHALNGGKHLFIS